MSRLKVFNFLLRLLFNLSFYLVSRVESSFSRLVESRDILLVLLAVLRSPRPYSISIRARMIWFIHILKRIFQIFVNFIFLFFISVATATKMLYSRNATFIDILFYLHCVIVFLQEH